MPKFLEWENILHDEHYVLINQKYYKLKNTEYIISRESVLNKSDCDKCKFQEKTSKQCKIVDKTKITYKKEEVLMQWGYVCLVLSYLIEDKDLNAKELIKAKLGTNLTMQLGLK